ncbi:MAG: A/G-specific adenine glycosylase [Bacteroidota bacterium]|jgi:A/G-specific adenine glycosylase
MHPFADRLIEWYHANARDLPWRNTRNPFRIWLSEIILQQTRVEQGKPYYERFVAEFADISSLADSSEEKVLRLWQGLGYYSRARNLHKAARQVRDSHGGVFPKNYEDIRALSGVGDYTAAAIASFAFKLRYPVVDGNVYRFLSRLYGIDTPIDGTAGKKAFVALANELILDAPPDLFNQAVMEFGALQCVPVNPDCGACIFRTECAARKLKKVDSLPVKAKKQKVRDRYFHYLVIREGSNLYLRQRTSKDIWQHLWEFPMLESMRPWKPERLLAACRSEFSTDRMEMKGTVHKARHLLSHQSLHATFYEFTVKGKTAMPKDWKKVSLAKLEKYPMPRLIEKYLQQCGMIPEGR